LFLCAMIWTVKAHVEASEKDGVLQGFCEIQDESIYFEVREQYLRICLEHGTQLFMLKYSGGGNSGKEDTLIILNHIITNNTRDSKSREYFQQVAHLPSTLMIPECSFELADLGFHGKNDDLAAKFHMFALWVHNALTYKYRINREAKLEWRMNENEECPSPYRKCNNSCFGMCGNSCSCWEHICGDCQCHAGCEDHDYYCSCKSVFHPLCFSFTPFGSRRCSCCK